MFVRIPGWSQQNSVQVNGISIEGAVPGQYLALRRHWAAHDQIRLFFDMTTQQVRANQAVADDLGRVAFRRGPIIFCMESLDQPGHADEANLSPFSAALEGDTKAVWNAELLGGVEVLEHPGAVTLSAEKSLYFPVAPVVGTKPTALHLIPYYAWADADTGHAGLDPIYPNLARCPGRFSRLPFGHRNPRAHENGEEDLQPKDKEAVG